jgi:hypothetical protein
MTDVWIRALTPREVDLLPSCETGYWRRIRSCWSTSHASGGFFGLAHAEAHQTIVVIQR